jgi:thiol-disulfide isomerase/thioredoxin
VDLAIVVREGEDAELVPVAGKVTVFDFWATWCVPCKELDRLLMDLLRRFPALAVRKVNVVSWDSPIAKRHLAGVEALPYVRVFDAEGKPAFTRSGDPEKIARDVERLPEGR